MRNLVASAMVMACLVATPALASEVVFSNLGAGGSYQCCVGDNVNGGIFGERDVASPFTPSNGFTLDSIEVALTWLEGVNAGDILLRSDNGGLPGQILESFHVTGLPTFTTTSTVLAVGISTLHPVLTSGLQYWVVASISDSSLLSFNLNNTGDVGEGFGFNFGTTWDFRPGFTAGAFRVNGSPIAPSTIPEPASFLLLATGVVATIGRRRMRCPR